MKKKEIKKSISQKTKENYKNLQKDEHLLQKSLEKIKSLPKSKQKQILKALPKKMREFAEKNLFS